MINAGSVYYYSSCLAWGKIGRKKLFSRETMHFTNYSIEQKSAPFKKHLLSMVCNNDQLMHHNFHPNSPRFL